ncbi:MAG: universal stress protein [Stappiaceae bacterium]
MYKSVLLPIDLNQPSSWSKALPAALALCKTFDAELHIVTVVPDFGSALVGGFFPEEFEKSALEKVSASLKDFIEKNVVDGTRVKEHLAHGTIYEEINRAADKLECDLIILASHRPELKDYLLGPNAARVVRHASQSVMVVRD